MPEAIEAKGTKKEREQFYILNQHFKMALEDLENRYSGWDTKLELFYSYIDESGWPYSAEIFVPQTFTALFEKMARLNGGKPRGRLIPREGGDIIRAKINNELLNYQWDDAARVDKEPMVAKWARMDLNARIYGAAFGLVKWRYEVDSDGEVVFDGPVLKVLNNKDCLPNPAYSTVKNWFQYRDYITLYELDNVNDTCGEKPRYKNLKILRESIINKSTKGGDTRQLNYTPKGRELLGLSDYLGMDEDPDFRIVEIVTEYRDDRIISFAPKHGVIIRDEPNPYAHKQIPIVCLKYIPVDDDIYGLSEIEPIEKVQKAMNALTSQFIDAINMDLYRIMQVNPSAVQMHTLEWGPGKKWLMNEPGKSVVPLEHSMTATNQFVNVYSVLTQMFKEAMGELSAAMSTLKPFGKEKTATEVEALTTTRSVRDNFNQIFLAETIKEQMLYWLQMNQQFIFSDPEKQYLALRVVGREAMKDFERLGLDGMTPDTSDFEMYSAEQAILQGGEGELPMVPQYPVTVEGETIPKFKLEETGEMGTLYVVADDLSGSYDYIADVEPMQADSTEKEIQAARDAIGMLANPTILQLLQMEGRRPKVSEMIIDLFEKTGIKGAEKYFDVMESQEVMYGQQGQAGTNQGGAGLGAQGGGVVPPQAAPGMEGFGGMA